jgi:ABC-type branched-subunit amino acid transport system substrate-binding protein
MTPEDDLDRRTFVRRALGTCAGLVATRAAFSTPNGRLVSHAGENDALGPRAPTSFRIAIITARSGSDPVSAESMASCRMGAELATDEARRAATLLRQPLDAVTLRDDFAAARTLLETESLSAVVCALNARDTAELGSSASRVGVVLFNATASEDALRNEECARTTFHVAASDAMRADVLRASSVGDALGDGVAVELWNGHLERFGAAQLNDRYRARFAKPMDSGAWAGWFSVKVAWEASLRARAVDGAAIATYLERDAAVFDGHKGVPLSFRRWDHQLRQPLFVTARSEAASGDRARAQPQPSTVPSTPSPSRLALDSIGTGEEATTCRWR